MTRSFPSTRRVGGAVCAALLVSACGIDQGGRTIVGPTTPPPQPELVVVSGPITAFGSIHVNDLVLDTARAQIRIDGAAATQADLAVGQMIRAVALRNGTVTEALTVDYEDNVVGEIASIDSSAGSFTVLGQLVRTTAATRFAGSQLGTFAELRAGDRVSVSGIALSGGEIQATYVARAAANEPLEVTARIGALDTARLTFSLGGLPIDYSRALLLQLPSGIPSTNQIVEVVGTSIVNGALVAERVRSLPALPGTFTAAAAALNPADVPAGVLASAAPQALTSFVGVIANRFGDILVFDDLSVLITNSTTIVGTTPAQLNPGTRVLVDGRILDPSRIEALRIRLQ